ncbi:hypothetical protein NPX13_g1259 [Xylaria arbuscula]|uniref:NACHT domain-containing protein n=1 Tax=Xylaria arbuscula TaxID=114810 RepID=A0A9W8TQC2_9PEZI|nr:hypothetical protein NPX13_g1259 [Xylaria arbuscula]
MRSWKTRIKRVFKPKDEGSSISQDTTGPISSTSQQCVVSNAEQQPPPDVANLDLEPMVSEADSPHQETISQRLWNNAFEILLQDKDTVDLVKKYLMILMKVLKSEGGEDPSGASDLEDTILAKFQDREERQKHMRNIIEEGRRRIATTSKVAEGLSNAVGYIEGVKGLISAAIADIPQAALPWAGVCIGLQILSNPGKAAKSNLTGIIHVTSRMDWYCALSDHLLGNNRLDESFEPMIRQLETAVINLYKTLLLYQVKSACYYYQSRGIVFLRGLANWDDWDGDLKLVKDAEATVETMVMQHHQEYEKSVLYRSLISGREREERLGDIHQDLQCLVNQQLKAWTDTKHEKCLRDLLVVDPRGKMKTIEKNKGMLLAEACQWIFQTEEYAAFTNWGEVISSGDPTCRLLWITGHAGMGKTMLLISMIRQFEDHLSSFSPRLSYFFCQSTDKALNNATSVLRNLIWLLLMQQPHLIEYIQPEHSIKGRVLFENEDAFHVLDDIFERMLQDTRLSPVYLIVDALDECGQGLALLLGLIAKSFTLSSKIRWLVSSRPEVLSQIDADVQEELRKLDESPPVLKILVQLHPETLERPVNAFIDYKLSIMRRTKGYSNEIIEQISSQVRQKAMNTFLWVALVFKELNTVPAHRAVQAIEDMPRGLQELYNGMMDRIEKLSYPQDYKEILISVSLAFRPLSLLELATISGLPTVIDVMDSLVAQCGSFLTVAEGTVSLIHQSAKDYLDENFNSRLQVNGSVQGHLDIWQRSISAMSKNLKENIYGASNLDFNRSNTPPPDLNPLDPVRYACLFWVDYISSSSADSDHYRQVLSFLKTHLLHWLEANTLMGKLGLCLKSIENLELLSQGQGELHSLVHDAKRFMLKNAHILESAPLQLYSSAILFSPQESIMRQSFEHNTNGTRILTGSSSSWERGFQTFDCTCKGVIFSPNGESLIMYSDSVVEIRNATTGQLELKLEGHADDIVSMALFYGTGFLATGSIDKTIRLWKIATGKNDCILEGHEGRVDILVFSPCGSLLASFSGFTLRLWDVASRQVKREFQSYVYMWEVSGDREYYIHEGFAGEHIAMSRDGSMLALQTGAAGQNIEIRELSSWQFKHSMKGHSSRIFAFTFLSNDKLLSTSRDGTFLVWNIATGNVEYQYDVGHLVFLVLSPDGCRIASMGYKNYKIRVWDTTSLETSRSPAWIECDFGTYIHSVVFSSNGKTLAAMSPGGTIYVWDTTTKLSEPKSQDHATDINILSFSPDGKTLASCSHTDLNIQIWDVATGRTRNMLSLSEPAMSITFSPDGGTLVSSSWANEITICDVTEGNIKSKLQVQEYGIQNLTFSPTGQKIACSTWSSAFYLWDLATGDLTLRLDSSYAFTFSLNGERLASASQSLPGNPVITLRNITTGLEEDVFKCKSDSITSLDFSNDEQMIASGSGNGIIEIWDVTSGPIEWSVGVDDAVTRLMFSQDGDRLACEISESIQVWRVSTRQLEHTFSAYRPSLSYEIFEAKEPFHMVERTRRWVTRNGSKFLYLPPEVQPDRWAAHGRFLATANKRQFIIVEFPEAGNISRT